MPTEAPISQPVEIEVTELIKDRLTRYRRKGSINTRCVVFVHGVTGNMLTTWRKDVKAQIGFIELILHDSELQDYDVFSFGYRSTYVRGAPIDNAALQLGNALSALGNTGSSLVFIAHSMGGLVCMKYIIDQLQQSNIPPVAGLLLLGTPTTGSDLINIARLVGYGIGWKIPGVRIAVNLFLRGQRQLTDLATGSEFLTRLHTEWAYRVVNGGHEKATNQRMWLAVRAITGEDDFAVKEASGKGVYGAIDWVPLSYGHIQLAKPEAANDERFMVAKRFLQICRRTDPLVLDRVWKASLEIWSTRFSRVSENLQFFTAIRPTQPSAIPQRQSQALQAYGTCETVCQYDFILEKDHIEFGVSFGDNDLWRRRSPPVYIHQIGLNLLPQKEKNVLSRSLESILDQLNDDEIWQLFFPKLSLRVDGATLTAGEFAWPNVPRRYAKWLLRRYDLAGSSALKVGRKVTLKMEYESIVPLSLPHFVFSTPWIVHGAKIQVIVDGDFEYFVPSHGIVPPGKVEQVENQTVSQREVKFEYSEIMLPGSSMEVRWQRR